MRAGNVSSGKADKKPALARPAPTLCMPAIPREFLERPRLRMRFDAALARHVSLVTAPAGYGKTVFLSQGLAHIDSPVAWLSLDKRDNDLARFWASLIAALQKVEPSLGEHALTMLQFGKPPVESALTELINEIAEGAPDLKIVLDDYHEIDTQGIHDSLAYLIEYLPPQVRLIIASRVHPPLSFARLRGRGHLTEIQAAELQFTPEETSSFMNEVMGLDLSKEKIDYIYNRTEGWIAGLQMVAVSLQGLGDAAKFMPEAELTSKEIMEYLTKEVLEQQEEHVRNFLLQTSILERLTEKLCNAVTGLDDSQPILEKLVASHLFLQPLDNAGRWFRYHQLFSDLLHKQLKATQPQIIPALHNRASQWFERQGLMEDSIEHALAAEEFDRAAALLRRSLFTVLGQCKQSVILNWIAKLPERMVADNLTVCIASTLACEATRQPESSEPYRRYATSVSETLAPRGQESSPNADTTLGYLVLIKSLGSYHDGDVSQAIKVCQEGLDSLPEGEAMARSSLNHLLGWAYWRSGNLAASYHHLEEGVRISRLVGYSYITIQATALLAHIRFAWGHLHSAAEACRDAIQLGTTSEGRESPVVCYARILLGEILYQWNSLDSSEDNVIRAIRASQEHLEPVIHLNGHMALARIAIAQGQLEAALETARRARRIHENNTQQHLASDVFMTRLWLMAGNASAASDHAQGWVNSLSISSDDFAQVNLTPEFVQRGIYGTDVRDIWTEIPLLTWVRLRMAQGKLDGLTELLDRVCREGERGGWTNVRIEALILKALALHAEGKLKHALKTLENVLALTESEGYVRVFADEGLPMFQLLRRAASRGIAPSYISKLLGALDMHNSHNPDQSEQSGSASSSNSQQDPGLGHMHQPLTNREIELLELIAAGMPNREIAHKLFIALPTVKNYLHTLYGKLDVNNRTQAVMRAHELGLLKGLLPRVQ